MIHWSETVHQLTSANIAHVLVTILGVRGSAPRDAGTKMVVTLNESFGTIGGGQLEYSVINQARELLEQKVHGQQLENFPLGPKFGQCCGGSTVVLFEAFQAQYAELMLFGGGHVAKALCQILCELPIKTKWVDNRPQVFDDNRAYENVTTYVSREPVKEVANARVGSFYLVMTHDHQLDFDLCCAILARDDAAFIGLIGSRTKNLRFQSRLAKLGFSESAIDQIHCPVGLSSVTGKRPMEVAVSISAQIIEQYQTATENQGQGQLKQQSKKQGKKQGVQWKQISHVDKSEFRFEQCDSCSECAPINRKE